MTPRERMLMKNIAYAGALVAILDIDMPIVEQLLAERFAGKKALRESNTRALMLGYEYAREHFDCPLPFHLERMNANADKILIDGNTAAALGCVYAGATVAAWYPITPATSVMDAFKEFCERYRKDPTTGRNNYVILQAEDELAAIGMVIGAMLERRSRVHVHRRPWHLPHERTAWVWPITQKFPSLLLMFSVSVHPRACRRVPNRLIFSSALTHRTGIQNISCCSRQIRPSVSSSRLMPSILRSVFKRP